MNTSGWEVPTFETHEFAAKRTRFCVCIPVINEGERIHAQLKTMQELGIGSLADILVADGGSTDGSLSEPELRRLGVRSLLVMTSPGKLSAQLRMVYSYALMQGYEGLITIDGNNKDGPEAIPAFIRELENGADMIQGSRFLPGGQAVNTPWIRSLAIRILHAPVISLAAGFRFTDTTNGFRAYSSKYLLDDRVQPFRNVFLTYELLPYLSVRAPQLGFSTKEVPVRRDYPNHGPIPTKLGATGPLLLLKILFKTWMSAYHPRSQSGTVK